VLVAHRGNFRDRIKKEGRHGRHESPIRRQTPPSSSIMVTTPLDSCSIHQTELERLEDGTRAVADAELRKNVGRVVLDRPFG
jgi:hypothetical protein